MLVQVVNFLLEVDSKETKGQEGGDLQQAEPVIETPDNNPSEGAAFQREEELMQCMRNGFPAAQVITEVVDGAKRPYMKCLYCGQTFPDVLEALPDHAEVCPNSSKAAVVPTSN